MTNKELQILTLLEIISPNPNNDRPPIIPTEEERNAVHERYKENSLSGWDNIFEPIKDENTRNKLIELFKELDKNDE